MRGAVNAALARAGRGRPAGAAAEIHGPARPIEARLASAEGTAGLTDAVRRSAGRARRTMARGVG
jgi:hypothetical protein